jgi:hypothetical protein
MFAGKTIARQHIERIERLASQMAPAYPDREALLEALIIRLCADDEEVYRLLCDAARDPKDALALYV